MDRDEDVMDGVLDSTLGVLGYEIEVEVMEF
jgi:hypothetical protein